MTGGETMAVMNFLQTCSGVCRPLWMARAVVEAEGLESFFTPAEETRLFLLCILAGMGLGLVFDCLRVFRTFIPHNSLFTALEDIAFFLFWTGALLTFALEEGRGRVRLYFLIGNILGFVFFRLTLGNPVMAVLRGTVKIVRRFCKAVFKGLCRFLYWLFYPVGKLAKWLGNRIFGQFYGKIRAKLCEFRRKIKIFFGHNALNQKNE